MAKSRFYPDADPFTFMIETVDDGGKKIDCLAGSNNIRAARAVLISTEK